MEPISFTWVLQSLQGEFWGHHLFILLLNVSKVLGAIFSSSNSFQICYWLIAKTSVRIFLLQRWLPFCVDLSYMKWSYFVILISQNSFQKFLFLYIFIRAFLNSLYRKIFKFSISYIVNIFALLHKLNISYQAVLMLQGSSSITYMLYICNESNKTSMNCLYM